MWVILPSRIRIRIANPDPDTNPGTPLNSDLQRLSTLCRRFHYAVISKRYMYIGIAAGNARQIRDQGYLICQNADALLPVERPEYRYRNKWFLVWYRNVPVPDLDTDAGMPMEISCLTMSFFRTVRRLALRLKI